MVSGQFDEDSQSATVSGKDELQVRCEQCGRFDAEDRGGVPLCPECCEERGSCCLEFGEMDLWAERE